MYPLEIINSEINDVGEENIAPTQYRLIRVRTMCPAVMFAANRNDRVIGRTKILVVSIITKNGFSHSGAPSGRKCAIDFFGEYENDEMIILNHIGRPIDSVKIRCLDDDSEYGTIPIKLMAMIATNSVVTIDDIPFKWIDDVRDSCVIIVSTIGYMNILFRWLIFHICGWVAIINIILSIIAIVVDGINSVKLIGSKIEKMSLIIKIWLLYHLKLWRLLVWINLKSYFSHESHAFIITGFRIKYIKYVIVATWPIVTYGSSTGRPPIHVSTSHVLTRVQNMSCPIG